MPPQVIVRIELVEQFKDNCSRKQAKRPQKGLRQGAYLGMLVFHLKNFYDNSLNVLYFILFNGISDNNRDAKHYDQVQLYRLFTVNGSYGNSVNDHLAGDG